MFVILYNNFLGHTHLILNLKLSVHIKFIHNCNFVMSCSCMDVKIFKTIQATIVCICKPKLLNKVDD